MTGIIPEICSLPGEDSGPVMGACLPCAANSSKKQGFSTCASGPPGPQAEVHVVKGHGKVLVQALQLVVHLGAHQQAGRRHGREVLHRGRPEHVAAAAPRLILMAVPRVAPQAGDDARVLNLSLIHI